MCKKGRMGRNQKDLAAGVQNAACTGKETWLHWLLPSALLPWAHAKSIASLPSCIV